MVLHQHGAYERSRYGANPGNSYCQTQACGKHRRRVEARAYGVQSEVSSTDAASDEPEQQ